MCENKEVKSNQTKKYVVQYELNGKLWAAPDIEAKSWREAQGIADGVCFKIMGSTED